MPDAKWLDRPWAWLVGGVLISAWLYGVLHAFDGHDRSTAILAVILPPIAWYMSAEAMIGPHQPAGIPVPPGGSLVEGAIGLRAACLANRESQRRLRFTEQQFEAFCICVSQMIAENFPEGESEYLVEHGKNSPAFNKIRINANRSCLASAQYLGGQ